MVIELDQNGVRKAGTIGAIVGLVLIGLAQAVGVDVSALHLPGWVDKAFEILGLGFTLIPHTDKPADPK